jgi:hypothetical protein
MSFVLVDFIVMDTGINTSSPIILGRPFSRTTCAIIDSMEGNVKFQFPHKKCILKEEDKCSEAQVSL